MKTGTCMRLKCVECGIWHDIPEDKMDDFNIYRKWNGVGSPVMSAPQLLCPTCSKLCYQKAISRQKNKTKAGQNVLTGFCPNVDQ